MTPLHPLGYRESTFVVVSGAITRRLPAVTVMRWPTKPSQSANVPLAATRHCFA